MNSTLDLGCQRAMDPDMALGSGCAWMSQQLQLATLATLISTATGEPDMAQGGQRDRGHLHDPQ